ncbi:mechanosensitive ion channel family protein [Candidatus Palauibacter sp.]|uniref:mechanosensitive ion channel family protein n=1 Tax=Candidatus Palauibacter sp. TaxID=3101350 RepID=UPI003B0106BF
MGIPLSWDSLLDWWNAAAGYAASRWMPSLSVVLLAAAAYFLGGWILRRVQNRVAARTDTDLDDEFLRTARKVFRLGVVAWAVWSIADLWTPGEAEIQPASWVWGIWTGLIFFPISRLVVHMLGAFEARAVSRGGGVLDETALPMVNRFVRFAVVATGVLLAMAQLGLNIGPLLAGAGVVGLALSLAAKDTLSNLIAGVLLILDRPFQVGDRIELWSAPRETGTWGDVVEIGLRATKIRNPDNLVVVVPNNEIMRRDIVNYTMSGGDIRLRIPFSCTDADIDAAKSLLVEVARGVEGVKADPAPVAIVRGCGPSEVNLQLRVWIVDARKRRRIGDQITEQAVLAFTDAGVEMPYPKQELYIRRDGWASPGESE